jgi:hypothetical protein
MRPGSIHAVFTPRSAICFGNHFYTITTISDTVYTIIHTFVGSSALTNTEHNTDSRMLLRRILLYIHSETVGVDFIPTVDRPIPTSGHIPALDSYDGVVTFFNLLNIIELGDILHPGSYTWARLGLKERVEMIHSRKLARQLRHWFWCYFDISVIPHTSSSEEFWRHREIFYFAGLAYQVKAILAYKEAATAADMRPEVEGCTDTAVESMISNVFSQNTTFWQAWGNLDAANNSLETLCWTGWMKDTNFEVLVRQLPMPHSSKEFGLYHFIGSVASI